MITDWAEQFDTADVDSKKMILAHLIERIDISRDYHIVIKFFVSLEDFMGIEQEGGSMDDLRKDPEIISEDMVSQISRKIINGAAYAAHEAVRKTVLYAIQ